MIMKKYLVIKAYKFMESTVAASFDDKDDAVAYARLSEKMCDGKFSYIVAALI
jgi:hypothetical protein